MLFAGDTAYTDAFAKLRRRVSVDLAILPIGAYDPWIANHASPEQAWAMFKSIGASYLLPVHHSTFRLSREPVEEPMERLLAAARAESWRIVAPEMGATWVLPTALRVATDPGSPGSAPPPSPRPGSLP